ARWRDGPIPGKKHTHPVVRRPSFAPSERETIRGGSTASELPGLAREVAGRSPRNLTMEPNDETRTILRQLRSTNHESAATAIRRSPKNAVPRSRFGV